MTQLPPSILAYVGATQALKQYRGDLFGRIGEAISNGQPITPLTDQLLTIWQALGELYVPPSCLKLHRAHHEAMKTVLRLFTEGVAPFDIPQIRQLEADAHESFTLEEQELVLLIRREATSD